MSSTNSFSGTLDPRRPVRIQGRYKRVSFLEHPVSEVHTYDVQSIEVASEETQVSKESIRNRRRRRVCMFRFQSIAKAIQQSQRRSLERIQQSLENIRMHASPNSNNNHTSKMTATRCYREQDDDGTCLYDMSSNELSERSSVADEENENDEGCEIESFYPPFSLNSSLLLWSYIYFFFNL